MFYLFRSRWFALMWVALIAIRAAVFAAGTGGLLVGLGPSMHASSDAAYKDAKFRSWSEDDNTRMSDTGTDPSRADKVRDGISPDDSQYRSSSNSNSDSSDSQ